MNKCLDKAWVQYALFILISVIYFLGISQYFDISLEELKALEPNTLGDFLAGTFSCLGFILLILGYLQNTKALKNQGEELKQNTRALTMQAEELRNSVIQQKTLVEATKEELIMLSSQHQDNQMNYYNQRMNTLLKEKFNVLPVIRFEYNDFAVDHLIYKIINIGSPVADVYLSPKESINYITPYITILKSSAEQSISINGVDRNAVFAFEIRFTTILGHQFRQTFANQTLENDSKQFVIKPLNSPQQIHNHRPLF